MDLDISYLSVDLSNETQQPNTNYLDKPSIEHACLSIGSSINSNTTEYMDGKIITTSCEFSGQSDTNSNMTSTSVPSVSPNVPSCTNNMSRTPYLPGTASFNIDYRNQMQSPYIAGNPCSKNPQTDYFSSVPSSKCSFGCDPVNINREPVYPMFDDFPVPVSCQFNDLFGTSRVFGYGESAPYEDIITPTVTVEPNFFVEHECERLGKRLCRISVDERKVIQVMGHRPVVQRVAILQKYRSMYGKNLPAKFNSKLNGCFKDCLIALCYTPAEFDAIELRRAMRGPDTDKDTIIEILCSRTNEHIRRIKNVYPKLFNGRDLEDDVNDDTEHLFKSIHIALLRANRDEFTFIDGNLVQRDVEELIRALKQNIRIEESKFIPILITRSYGHLRAVFNEYSSLNKCNLEEEMSGHGLNTILSIVRCIQNRPRYFAEKLIKATKNTEKDLKTIIRIIVTRCEVDMGQIKEEFLNLYGKSLKDCLKYVIEAYQGIIFLKIALIIIYLQ
ncbi:putative annexin [Schistosoma mansoni]|uniref:putative annexin n=1 Tax=Schistosoma mansoni TaxID=6183 RepID=UPI00022DC2CC|nr:putative annexin [Schistosoma mansoni]|eukprot:XP_018651721.1 putative annexin [Schistosoma mansoni]